MSAAPAWNSDEYWDLFSLNELAEAGVDAYLQQLAEKAADIFNASGASIFLSDSSTTLFRVRARAGRQSTVPADACIERGEGVAGLVVETGEARILGDLSREGSFRRTTAADRIDVSSSMVLPLIEPDGTVIGVLNFSRHACALPFQESDLERAKAVASHVALAASNARLMERLNKQIHKAQDTSDRLKAVFDSVGSSLLVFDEKGLVVDCNASGREYLVSGSQTWEVTDALAPGLKSAIRKMCETDRPATVHAEDAEHEQFWLVQGTPVVSGGLVVTITDITEHEIALKEAERLRRLAEIGQMTATIAHEIRNPLTGIRSAAQVVRDDPSVAEEFLGVIEEEVLKLNALCEQFLAFAKPLQLSLEPTELGELVETVCKLQQSDFDSEGVELTVETGLDRPKMNLDRRRIEQVVHNLSRNARQACRKGGHVIVRVDGSKLIVEDDGAGMTEEQRERLFTPFFTTKSYGAGLGLSNVRRILDAHCASVTVETEPGQGSRFTVEFVRSLI